ncbi:MAG TPA: SRPBCC family protein [Flavipsychrobacter sp.]|nr:SRPBCC family protein [Flavipsychrobacter sp.]
MLIRSILLFALLISHPLMYAQPAKRSRIEGRDFKEYHFVSNWQLKTPLDSAWNVIVNSLEWHEWWRSMEDVTTVKEGGRDSIGNIRRYTIKSPVGYRLRFDLLLTRYQLHSALEGMATGDLVGKGSWHFKQIKDITYITCRWDVKTTKGWMNTFRWVLAPILKWNHALVMKKGAKGLSHRLDCPLIAY